MPVVACGFLEQGLGVTPGDKYQNTIGATVISAGIGLRQVTLDDLTLTDADVVIDVTTRAAPTAGVATQTNGIVNGVFTILTYKSEAADQSLIDVQCSFTVRRIPRQH